MPASLTLRLDGYDVDAFTALAARYGQTSFGFVITPNVDHVIRFCDDGAFRAVYTEADFVLLDSRLLARLLRLLRGLRLPVCPGSDLAARLVPLLAPDDPVVLIGGSAEQAQRLAELHGLRALRHHNPPMGFIRNPDAVDQALRFIEANSPFRFCFLAVGSPQQELLAAALKRRGTARGLAICVGASINFLTGAERRAPRWMQRLSLEWLFRLLQDPRRMAGRYLLRGPRIFLLLPRLKIESRAKVAGAETASRESTG